LSRQKLAISVRFEYHRSYGTLSRMSSKNKQKRGKKNMNVSSSSMSVGPVHPPPIRGIELKHRVTLRYISNATIAQNITYQNLLDLMLVASTTTNGYDLFEAVKIKRIVMYATPVTGAPTSMRLEFSGGTTGLVGDQDLYTDTSMGIQPAYINAKPDQKSLAANWQKSGTSIAFTLNAPVNTVIDLHLDLRSQFSNANPVAQNALVAANVGGQYLRGLDGAAVATSLWLCEFAAAQI